jgi:hypothetical protein
MYAIKTAEDVHISKINLVSQSSNLLETALCHIVYQANSLTKSQTMSAEF